MARVKFVTKYVFAIFFVGAGMAHFVLTDAYVSFMPPYIPYHLELVYLSGLAEIALGLALVIPPLTRVAAWGIIALLVAVFPANIHVYQNPEHDPRDEARPHWKREAGTMGPRPGADLITFHDSVENLLSGLVG